MSNKSFDEWAKSTPQLKYFPICFFALVVLEPPSTEAEAALFWRRQIKMFHQTFAAYEFSQSFKKMDEETQMKQIQNSWFNPVHVRNQIISNFNMVQRVTLCTAFMTLSLLRFYKRGFA